MSSWLFDKGFTREGKIVWVTLLLLVFLVPITFSIPPNTGVPFTADVFDTPKVWLLRVGVMILLAAWGSDIAFNGGKIRYSKAVLIMYGVLSAIFIASTITSIEPMQSFLGKYRRYDGLWSFLLYGVLLWVTMQYATSFRRIKQILQVFSASSMVVAGYGLLQALGLEPLAWGVKFFEDTQSFSTYGNPNLLAGFLAFGIFINFGLALSEEEAKLKSYYWVATLLNAAVSITAFSRSVWVASVFGIIIVIIYMLRFRPHLTAVDYGFTGATVTAVTAFIVRSLSSESIVMNFVSRVSSIFDFKTGSAATRFQIWESALRAIKERPLLGWGPDTFRMVFRGFQHEGYNQDAGYRSVADNAHNYPLQVAAGIGVIGAVLLHILQFWIIGLAARYCWTMPSDDSAIQKSKRGKEERQQAYKRALSSRMCYVGVLAAVVTYIIHLSFGLSLPGATFLLWIGFGILLVPPAQTREVQPLARAQALACCGALIAFGCAISIWASTLLWADHLHIQSQAAQSYDRALTLSKQSTKLSPSNDQYAIRFVENNVKAASQGLVSMEMAAQEVRKLTVKFPNEYDVYLMALWAYNAFGQADSRYIDEGLALAKVAVEKYPQGLAMRYAYAEMLVTDGQDAKAVEQLEFAVASDSNFKEARELLEELR